MLTAVCVLRTGGDFGPVHVQRLHAALAGHWPTGMGFRFVALTDEPMLTRMVPTRALTRGWQRWWSKMELFAPEHDDLGDLLYFDLDTMIVGDLTQICGAWSCTLLRDFYKPKKLASGLMCLPRWCRAEVWEAWTHDPEALMKRYRGGDGDVLDALWAGRALTWQEFVPDQVVSYKAHVRPAGAVPAGARVVCFHGSPRPWFTPLWSEQ